jgi:hypothetical protein
MLEALRARIISGFIYMYFVILRRKGLDKNIPLFVSNFKKD